MGTAFEVAFMGGPADGLVRVVQGEGDQPPNALTFPVTPATWDQPVGEFTYIRQVSQMDEGPLWIYVPTERGW